MRTLLTISYDGTDYCGWQRQKGQLTVQEAIEKTISRLYGERVDILGASRTDSGVHAKGQRATFRPPDFRIPTERLYIAINAYLPKDIRILSSTEVSDDFHVINDVKNKTYEYRIQNKPIFDPIMYRYSYNERDYIDTAKMVEASKYFIGEHDFKSFCAAHSAVQTTVRTIFDLSVTKDEDIVISVCGDGFLYNMVRIIAGTLLYVGLGKFELSDIPKIISEGNRANAGMTLPANGLTLVNVAY